MCVETLVLICNTYNKQQKGDLTLLLFHTIEENHLCVKPKNAWLKGAFFQKVRWTFFRSPNLKKVYSKKLSWACNSNFPPITVKCYWREIWKTNRTFWKKAIFILLHTTNYVISITNVIVIAKIIASDIDLPVIQNELLSLIVLHLPIFLVFQVPISEYIDLC